MSNEVKRNYKGSNAEMLTAIAAIVQAAIDNQTELAAKRASWADPFFPNLQKEIDDAVKTYLGADSAKNLRQSTAVVEQIQTAAISDLTEVKVQIERDFRKNKTTRDELLNALGYKNYFTAARQKDQGALVQLLYRFKQSLTPAVQTQLTANGIDASTLTAIAGFANQLNTANVSQESFKSSRKTSTDAAVTALNAIFNKAMDVSVIAATLFKSDKAKQQRFNYTKVLKAQQGGGQTTPAKPVAVQPEKAA